MSKQVMYSFRNLKAGDSISDEKLLSLYRAMYRSYKSLSLINADEYKLVTNDLLQEVFRVEEFARERGISKHIITIQDELNSEL